MCQRPGPDLLPAVERAGSRLERRHVGAVLGVLDLPSDQRIVRGVGHRSLPDGPAPDANTAFEIGSITKTFTALMLAQAVIEGRMSLDTPLTEVLPAGTMVPSRGGVAITVEHLARHQSGLPRSPERLGARAIWQTSTAGANPYANLSSDRLLELLGRTALRRTPGSGRPGYSNFGGGLLGLALIHSYAADSYAELVQRLVLAPLGLRDTFVMPGPGSPEVAQGHAWRRHPAPAWWLDALDGAGALRSTANDQLTYLRAQLDPDSTPLGPAIRLSHSRFQAGRGYSIGLGWIRSSTPGGAVIWHNGGTGGFRSFAGFHPEHRRAVVVLVNDQRGVDRVALQLLIGDRKRR